MCQNTKFRCHLSFWCYHKYRAASLDIPEVTVQTVSWIYKVEQIYLVAL